MLVLQTVLKLDKLERWGSDVTIATRSNQSALNSLRKKKKTQGFH